MKTNERKNQASAGGTSWKWIIIPLVCIVLCSIISWLLVSKLAASKSDHASDFNRLNNSLGHVKAATKGLDNLAAYQHETIQTTFDDIEGQLIGLNDRLDGAQKQLESTQKEIRDIEKELWDTEDDLDATRLKLEMVKQKADGVDTLNVAVNGINTKISTIETKSATLDSSINELKTTLEEVKAKTNGAVLITPVISTTSTGGTITLTIKTDTAQSIAFKIELRPVTENPLTATTYEVALKALYENPPFTLTAGSTSLMGDYNLYWKGGTINKYYLSSVVFTTPRTALTAGTNTKTITYTGIASYTLLITPIDTATTSTSGATTSSW